MAKKILPCLRWSSISRSLSSGGAFAPTRWLMRATRYFAHAGHSLCLIDHEEMTALCQTRRLRRQPTDPCR
jgi:hypothetical protein